MKSHHKELNHNAIVGNGLFTFTYIGLLLLVLYYFDQLARIGRFSSMYILIILLTGDLIKSKFSNSRPLQRGQVKRMLLLTCVTILFFAAVAILYGAPLTCEHEQTLMFGLIITVLTMVHSLIHIGVRDTLEVLSEPLNLSGELTAPACALRNLQFTVAFAWSSTVVIPLDWNRPWQAWPVPCCIGAMVGFAFGHLLSVAFVFSSKFRKHHRTKMRAV